MMDHVNMNPAAPKTFVMNVETFFLWLKEVQGVSGDQAANPPSIRLDDEHDHFWPESRYFRVSVYLDTSEGTVIARHLSGGEEVEVTMRHPKPGEGIRRVVQMILDELSGEKRDAA